MYKKYILIIVVAFIGIYFLIILKNQHSPVSLPLVELGSTGFKIENEPFKFIGVNTVNLIFYDEWGLSVEDVLKAARASRIKVIRLYMDWGGWGKPEDYDRVLDLASKYGIYVILTLTDCSKSNDYLDLDTYFSIRPFCDIANEKSRSAYKRRIKHIIMHKNSINGKIYRDDTTIFAWDIANEIEYWNFKPSQINSWIREISGFIKSLDQSHLVTIGLETSLIGGEEGISYEDFNTPEIDFFSFHFYSISRNWDKEQPISDDYIKAIKDHTSNFIAMGKPVILEEFGFSGSGKLDSSIRSNPDIADLYYEVFKNSMDAAFSAGASGVMFWGLGVPEAKKVPMWWAPEIHDIKGKKFMSFIRDYKIP